MQSEVLVNELEARRAGARARASAGWLPLFLTGAAMIGSFPAYAGWLEGPASETSSAFVVEETAGDTSYTPQISDLASGDRSVALYWFGVLPVVYLISALWFAGRSRRSGLRLRWELHLWAGAALLALLLLSLHPVLRSRLPASVTDVLTPLVAVSGALLVLAKVERSTVIAAAAGAVGLVAGLVVALDDHVTSLRDSTRGTIGQALLAPGVEVAAAGVLLVVLGLLLARSRRRTSRTHPAGSSHAND